MDKDGNLTIKRHAALGASRHESAETVGWGRALFMLSVTPRNLTGEQTGEPSRRLACVQGCSRVGTGAFTCAPGGTRRLALPICADS